jgi:hypothetical protein
MARTIMISDNDLLLYHYRDGLDPQEHERIHVAVATQPQLAARLRALLAELDRVSAIPEVPVPDDVVHQWQNALDRAASNERAAAKSHGYVPVSRLRWSVAALAGAAIVTVISLQFGVESSGVRPADPSAQLAMDSEALSPKEHGLRWHLASSERQLAALSDASAEERARLIDTVIAQNRLHALAAERAGDTRLARALRSFTPILESLAAPDANRSPSGDLAQLNFELRVMQARLAAEAPAAAAARSVDL